MKLRFLLMPVAVIISVVLIIWHIWPRIFDKNDDGSIVSLNSEIKKEQAEIEKITQRKKTVTEMESFLDANSDIRDLITAYYPDSLKEENIINKINQMAFSSGVFISDMDIVYGNTSGKSSPDLDVSKLLRIPQKDVSDKQNDVKALLDQKNIVNSGAKALNRGIGMLSVEMDILGTYEQTKRFLTALYYTGLLGNIQEFDVGVPGDVKNKQPQEDVDGNENGENNNSEILETLVTVNFAYGKKNSRKLSDMLEDPLFAVGKINLDDIEQKKDSLIAKYPDAEVGDTGEANPFFPTDE